MILGYILARNYLKLWVTKCITHSSWKAIEWGNGQEERECTWTWGSAFISMSKGLEFHQLANLKNKNRKEGIRKEEVGLLKTVSFLGYSWLSERGSFTGRAALYLIWLFCQQWYPTVSYCIAAVFYCILLLVVCLFKVNVFWNGYFDNQALPLQVLNSSQLSDTLILLLMFKNVILSEIF